MRHTISVNILFAILSDKLNDKKETNFKLFKLYNRLY